MKIAAIRSQRSWAIVVVCNPSFNLLFVSQLSTTHCVCVEVQTPSFSFYVVSYYFQYSDEIDIALSGISRRYFTKGRETVGCSRMRSRHSGVPKRQTREEQYSRSSFALSIYMLLIEQNSLLSFGRQGVHHSSM